jgi:16S rRNA (uracil1498-N3)-methyltransferase
MLRLYVGPGVTLAAGAEFDLPAGPARHVQVRRGQPGDALVLFDGHGGEWRAAVVAMARDGVRVRVETHHDVDREAPCAVTVALAVPANERMDALIEKATELGVAALQPLLGARSVLRLEGERAARRMAHWQGVAQAAAEQCGRTRVPPVAAVRRLEDWLLEAATGGAGSVRWLLQPGAAAFGAVATARPTAVTLLSGPEGGWTEAEVGAATAAGFAPVGLGPRILRADTAPLAVLAWLGLRD